MDRYSTTTIVKNDMFCCTEFTESKKDVFYSIDEAVNKAGYGKFQIKLTFLTGLGWVADAFEIFILSVVGDFMACDWVLYRWHIALLTSIVFAGIMIGSPVLGTIADIYGRKKCLALSTVLVFVFGVASALSPSYVWMIVFRTCVGVALGGIGQGLTLYSEYCPTSKRGKVLFFLGYFWSFGSVGVILLVWLVMACADNWRILLGSAAIPALIVIITIKWYPESARYYLVSNQHEEASNVLEEMALTNKASLPNGKLINTSKNKNRGRIRDLLVKDYKKASLLFWYIWFASGFSYYGITLLSPILIQQGSLIENFSVNATHKSYYENVRTLVSCTKYTQENYIDLLWTSAAEIPALVIYTFLVECLDRKLFLCGSYVISSVLILLLLWNTHKILILLFLFGARGILVSIYILNYIMTVEAFPTTIRAIAIGTCLAFSRLGGLLVPFITQVLVIENPIVAMSLIAVVTFLAGVAALLLPFETRNTEMKEFHDDT